MAGLGQSGRREVYLQLRAKLDAIQSSRHMDYLLYVKTCHEYTQAWYWYMQEFDKTEIRQDVQA